MRMIFATYLSFAPNNGGLYYGWWFSLLKVPMVTTESGLQYKDIKVGQGPSPPIGFQVCEFVCLSFGLDI